MKNTLPQIMAFLRAPFKDGSTPREMPNAEFTEFWKSLTDDQKEEFKSADLSV